MSGISTPSVTGAAYRLYQALVGSRAGAACGALFNGKLFENRVHGCQAMPADEVLRL